MNEYKFEEYKMLRTETQKAFDEQRKLSNLSITTVVTLFGIALNLDDPEAVLYLLPDIVLVLVSFKLKNYKMSITRITAYMIYALESKDEIYWETSLNNYRKRYYGKLSIQAFFETFELPIMSAMCLLFFWWKSPQSDRNVGNIEFDVCVVVGLASIIITTYYSWSYWTMNANVIDQEMKRWRICTNSIDDLSNEKTK